jgi:hypothetical protein
VRRLSHQSGVLGMGLATYQSGDDKPSPPNNGAHLSNVVREALPFSWVEGVLFELSNNPRDAMRPPLPSKYFASP